MVKNSHSKLIEETLTTYALSDKYRGIVTPFFSSYLDVGLKHGAKLDDLISRFTTFLKLLEEQLATPYTFKPYHKQVLEPFDYHAFGTNFLKPLADLPRSSVVGKEHLKIIEKQLKNGDNVVFFANHQIEGDPQAISILLEEEFPFAKEIIAVAGERVVTDPLAIPFSLGCNLLCIYSKRYIATPPEQKAEKQQYNKRTMQIMSELFTEGGHAIYLAPSGGRDRRNSEGVIEVAKFDPQSIEMCYLMAKKAKRKTHFYPLSLATYDLLPPPETIQTELGEDRITRGGAIHLACGAEIDMELFPGSEQTDKQERRKARATYLYSLVKENYEKFPLVG